MDVMDAVADPNPLFALDERNKRATEVIKTVARRHARTDVIMGILAGAVPGGGIMATVGGIAIQSLVFYKPMVRELAAIYSASPDEVTNQIVGATVSVGILGEALASEFGKEFMQEILVDIIQDLGLSTGLSWIPGIGKILSAGADATVATALTWAVGAMTVVYFLNGGQFMGSRKATYGLCKELASQASGESGGVNLDDLPWNVPGLLQSMVNQALGVVIAHAQAHTNGRKNFVLSLLTFGRPKSLTLQDIKGVLDAKQVPGRVVEEVVRQGAGKVLSKAG